MAEEAAFAVLMCLKQLRTIGQEVRIERYFGGVRHDGILVRERPSAYA